jgi:5-methylcytosine-specific restriction endonuclease McrA
MHKSHTRYAVEFDIKGFFDNVDHSKLIKQMWALGIRDKKLIYVIKRLRLNISPEKTRVVNLEKQYSEFLGIKMRLRQKKDKLVVQSRVYDQAVRRIKTEAKEKIKGIARPSKGKTETRAVPDYNAFVMGLHNYYDMATDVSKDFKIIGYQVTKTVKRLGSRLKKSPKQKLTGAVLDRYGLSAQMRYIKNLPFAPIGYIQTKPPMSKKRSVQKYTPEGRKEIHENLGIDTIMLQALMRQTTYARSAEYADNRLSLYCAQYGKCAVTGQMIDTLEDIHCHHKLPKHLGGKDNYHNLVIIHENVHILIHATAEPTIEHYLSLLNLNKKQLAKVNKFRKEAGEKCGDDIKALPIAIQNS